MTPTPNTGLKEAVERVKQIANDIGVIGVTEALRYYPHAHPQHRTNQFGYDLRLILSALPPVVEAPGDQEGELSALREVFQAARGLCFGEDWNEGTMAKKHGYRRKLRAAVLAACRSLGVEPPPNGFRPSPEPEPVRELQGVVEAALSEALAVELADGGTQTPYGVIAERVAAQAWDFIAPALRALSPSSGFVMVPREPTEEMLQAGVDAATCWLMEEPWRPEMASERSGHAHNAYVYRAMIEASQGSVAATRSALPLDAVRSEGGDP